MFLISVSKNRVIWTQANNYILQFGSSVGNEGD